MTEQDIKIKDAPLVDRIKSSDKMPVSDGSNLPKTVSIGQITSFFDEKINTITEDTKKAIEDSKVQTNLAKELNQNPWKIDESNNHIWAYNVETKQYEDTGFIATKYPDFSQDGNDLIIKFH